MTTMLLPDPDAMRSVGSHNEADFTDAYEGFDVAERAVDWCRQNIQPERPDFRFHHLDAANGLYNPAGAFDPSTTSFPWPDDWFDRAILTSVFTHMTTDTVEQYLIELQRVLAPGGGAFVSFLLITPEAVSLPPSEDRLHFHRYDDHSWVVSDHCAEEAVGHDADRVFGCLSDLGFDVSMPPVIAKWADPTRPRGAQDMFMIWKA